jgi:hypothetical protein
MSGRSSKKGDRKNPQTREDGKEPDPSRRNLNVGNDGKDSKVTSWWKRTGRTIGVLGGVVAAVAAILTILGYNLRSFLERPMPLVLHAGSISLLDGEACEVIFALEPKNEKHPHVVYLPLTVENSEKRTANKVAVMIKCLSDAMKPLPDTFSVSTHLGDVGELKRTASQSGDLSTSTFSSGRIAPGSQSMLIDAFVWSQDLSKIDSPIQVQVSVSADDRPPATHNLWLRSAIATGDPKHTPVAFGKKKTGAKRMLLVWFENVTLMKMKAASGDDSLFFSTKDPFGDTKYVEIDPAKL